jgi:hypothetical protein
MSIGVSIHLVTTLSSTHGQHQKQPLGKHPVKDVVYRFSQRRNIVVYIAVGLDVGSDWGISKLK